MKHSYTKNPGLCGGSGGGCNVLTVFDVSVARQILLLPDRSQYIYMEKVRGGGSVGRTVREERTVLMSHQEPPASLKKKATLLWYFEGYLTGPSFKSRSDKHPGRVSGECVGPGGGRHYPEVAPPPSAAGESGLTNVKKWLKTKHAIIFRMSNKVIQVCASALCLVCRLLISKTDCSRCRRGHSERLA